MKKTAYVVYTDCQGYRVLPENAEYFFDLDDALDRANEMKEKLQYSDDWELEDEFDAEELTDADNEVFFKNKKTGKEAVVSIQSISIMGKESDASNEISDTDSISDDAVEALSNAMESDALNRAKELKNVLKVPASITEKDASNIIHGVPYTSVWNGGSRAITSNCSVNTDTREVFDIEPVSEDIEDLDVCDNEHIVLDGKCYPVCEKSEYDALPERLKAERFYRE